jgi:hypothetical protein
MLQPDPDRRADTIDDVLAFLRPPARSKRPERTASEPAGELTRNQKRKLRQERRRQEREERRKKRAAAYARRAPLVPRIFAKLGLLVALVAVWIAVGIVTPLVLYALSLVFGKALRRAAKACVRSARRAQAALGRASDWLSGHRAEPTNEATAFVRVATDLDRVRAVTEAEAQALAVAEAEARGEDAER